MVLNPLPVLEVLWMVKINDSPTSKRNNPFENIWAKKNHVSIKTNHSNVRQKGENKKESLILFVYAPEWKSSGMGRPLEENKITDPLIVSIRIRFLFFSYQSSFPSNKTGSIHSRVNAKVLKNSKAIKPRFPFCWFTANSVFELFVRASLTDLA